MLYRLCLHPALSLLVFLPRKQRDGRLKQMFKSLISTEHDAFFPLRECQLG